MTAEFPDFSHFNTREPPSELCTFDKQQIVNDAIKDEGWPRRGTYVVNGVPVTDTIYGCCTNEPCHCCRSDVIFYAGLPYDQKPFIKGRLRRRPHNVMYYEGKLIPPFGPGKSVNPRGHHGKKDKYKPTYNVRANMDHMAYGWEGRPYGEDTLGYFRFKPTKLCDCRLVPVQRLGECCTCEPGEYNPAQYETDDCPGRLCCC